MKTFRIKSSVVATVAGAALVFGAFAANTMTQAPSVAGVKGDRLGMTTRISCDAGCIAHTDRIAAAFDTVAAHDSENGVSVLTRVRYD
ncbi:hypothetical protein RDV64_12890 [Acuticoccus sp. MNP-M23]|uniref:hypothetical protein n=1 Tax=Acuticoccus sp. MNP-M23 TaxID=3072793 RepID=UPI002814F6C9|nr:hypothetical protein [Acuticoccus sp. MNP-M23]WMS40984.1 hypothetical protein RDV64_12890 [Acuticoccus sp. MNP-M23]